MDSDEKEELGIPDDFSNGTAEEGGDCFFESMAQGMNQLSIAGGPFTVKSLRTTCSELVKDGESTWRSIIENDAEEGGYGDFKSYLEIIQYTAKEIISKKNKSAIWGRPTVEG